LDWVRPNTDKPHRCPRCHAVATWGRKQYGPRTRLTCPRGCGVQWRAGSRLRDTGEWPPPELLRLGRPPRSESGLQHWDKYGVEIDMWSWAELFEDFDYRVVGDTQIGAYRVSTVWMGNDMSFRLTAYPLIFETMVFAGGTPHDMDSRRYRTLAEAEAGHAEFVTLLRATVVDVENVLEQDEPVREES